jgi:hypothetical protein
MSNTGTNYLRQFAGDSAANVLTADKYDALTARVKGFSAGIVPSVQFNTVMRGPSTVTTAIAQFVVDNTGLDVEDDGDVTGFETKFRQALASVLVTSNPPLYTGLDTSNSASNITAAMSPTMTQYTPEGLYVIRMNNDCVGPVQATLSQLTTVPVCKSNGAPLAGFEWRAGDLVLFSYNGSSLTLVNDKAVTTSTNINVSTVNGLIQAVVAASQIIIATNVYVTITLAPGTYNLTSITGPIYFAHMCGQRIRLIGAPLTTAFPTAANIGAKTQAQTLTYLQTVYQTIINTVGCNGLEVHTGAINTIQNILFTGDSTASGGHYGALVGNWSGEPGFGSVQMVNCWFHGFGLDNCRAEDQSLIQVNNVGSTYATQHGFHISHFSCLECNTGNILAMHCQAGLQLQNYGLCAIDSASGSCDFSYNINGVASQSYGAFNAFSCTGLRIQNNTYGIIMQVFASVALCSGGQTQFSGNTSADINVAYSSTIVTYGCPLGTCIPSRGGGFSGTYSLVV